MENVRTVRLYESQADARLDCDDIYGLTPGTWRDAQTEKIMRALIDAGVKVGAYDVQIERWLAGWEPETVQVIVGWIERAHSTGRASGRRETPR